MNEPKPLIIEAPRYGIAPSPHVGFGDVRNLDLYTTPGVARLNTALDKQSATTITKTPKWIVRDPNTPANVYAVDSDGDVWVSTDTGATWAALATQPTAGGEGQGLAIWKDYLFCARETAIDTYGPLSGTPSWTAFKTDLSSDLNWHPILVSKLDGKLYIGNGRYVASLEELAGQNFAPGTAATFTYTVQHLTLPEDYKVKCLAELGNNLMIGTWKGSTINQFKIADIFPWNGSDVTYGQPIQLEENGVNAMITIKNNLYISAGIDGAIYRSDGYNAVQVAQIPQHIADNTNTKYIEVYPGAIMNHKGRLHFGLSGSGANGGLGVYSLKETSEGNILMFENQISAEETGANDQVVIGALLSLSGDQYLCGWYNKNGTAYGIDMIDVDGYDYTTTYQGYFDSPLYQVGTYLNKRRFNKIEIHLAKEIAANEGVRLAYRINLTDSFTTIGTYTVTEIGSGKSTYILPSSIPASEFLQVKVSLTGTTTTPHFQRLILF